MKKFLSVLATMTMLCGSLPLCAGAGGTVNLTAFPAPSNIISAPRRDGYTYPEERPNGIYGTKAQIAADIASTAALTGAEKADLADIGYGVSAIGIQSFGRPNALRNLVDGNWSGATARMCFMTFDDDRYDVDGTANASGKYRALITLNFSTTHRFDACGFISGTQAGMINAADIYVSDDGENWALVPSASWDASGDEQLNNLVSDTAQAPSDTWTNYAKAPFATLFDMNGVSGQYIRIAVIKGRGGSSSPNTVNTREFLVYGQKTGAASVAACKNILFIGNSFTYFNTMPEQLFARMAEASGYQVNVSSITTGGHYLIQHGNINDVCGAQVYAALAENAYDYVVIQEQSSNAIKSPESFYTGVRRLVNLIRRNGAEPILYSTWGHNEGSETLAGMTGWDTESMTYGLAAAYNAIGEELGLRISQTGFAFWDVHSHHGDTVGLYYKDNYHPSALGSYLSAMTHFANILGGNPLTCAFNGTIDEATATILKQAAYDATYRTPAVPDEFKTTSVGVGDDGLFGVDGAKTVCLATAPHSPMISVLQQNGAFSGIRGDKDAVASAAYATDALTAEQTADMADIGYGVSAIGIHHMNASSAGYKTALANLVNGHWGTTLMCCLYFDDLRYDINGTARSDGRYRALLTFNFGSVHRFDACGFFSGDAFGFPAAADVYVSDDGENWTLVPSASYDGINHTAYLNLGTTARDPYNGNTAPFSVLFDMAGVTGKYIRLGILVGRSNAYANYNSINTREFVVYGNRIPVGDVDGNGRTDLADVVTALQNLLNGTPYDTYGDMNGDRTISLRDIIAILKQIAK
ncbi:MAG: hypothetical protein IJU41_09070 [Clostridia bacterium]|nr:hypothetical protein [Clostridia bacterium]